MSLAASYTSVVLHAMWYLSGDAICSSRKDIGSADVLVGN